MVKPFKSSSLKRRNTSETDQPKTSKKSRQTHPIMPSRDNAAESDTSPDTDECQKTANMATAFGETVAPTDAIRSILGSYPFSIGLLREIISNSDDAKASRQIFMLDRRTHGSTAIHHPYLAATQGPALLAYNDEIVQNEDWRALQKIHDSSKKTDTSKIGKYGVGFRASYHVTDTPNILSGSNLVILDPQHDFTESGGVQLNIENEYETYRDHLATFEPLFPSSDWGKVFQGSIFRLPLRTAASRISDEIASPEKISNLLNDFVHEELNVTLLFLRNITTIEVYEISVTGEQTQLATAFIDRETIEHDGWYEIRKATIRVNVSGSLEEKEWCVVHAPFSEKEAIDALSKRLGGNPTTTLAKHKLSPNIDLAIPLDWSAATKIGRLFTFQPLPLDTEFPIHINALFSLTSSRQNLRNAGEKGIVKGSEDEALIEWNRLLFDTYIPTAWVGLLDILVQRDDVQNIFEAWPRSQAKLQSGDYVYWKDAPYHIAKYALTLPIWPIYGTGSGSYGTITSLLVDGDSTEDKVLDALGRAGLQITQPPLYITQILRENHSSSIKILSPEVVHESLQALIPGLTRLNDADASLMLEYLTSTSDCRYIADLPLVPSVSGERVALSRSGTTHTLFDETEEELFSTYDSTAVSLKQIPSNVRKKFLTSGRQVLNMANLDLSKVVSYIATSPYGSQIRETATDVQIRWLDLFWNWAQKSTSVSNLDQFYLVPTTSGFQRPSDIVIDPGSDNFLAGILELLKVSVIDWRLTAESRRALSQLKPSSNIHSLLRSLPTKIGTDLSEIQADYLGAYLIRQLPTACYLSPLDAGLRARLRSLPIFPLLSPSPSGSVMHRDSIVSTVDVRGVDPSRIPILPQINSTVYLDLHHMSADILKYLDQKHHSPLSVEEMHDMMLNYFDGQSLEMQVAFMKYLASHSSTISRRVFDQMANIAFVRTRDGTLRSPKQLVDPQAAIATLYPGASSSLPDTSQPPLETLVTCLRDLKLFVIDLSLAVVRERIRYIASGTCSGPEGLARRLIALINESRLDCHHLFNTLDLSLDSVWIPTPQGLKSPLGCRDLKSHWGKHDLFDEVMPMVYSDIKISDHLRRAFPWDDEVPFGVLSQQLVAVLDGSEPPYGKVREIVKEIGNRDLTTAQLSSLRELLTPRAWIPARGQCLQKVTYALLGETDVPEIGFRSIAYDAYPHTKVRTFLKEMGCVEYPSKESILEHLKLLHESGPPSAIPTAAIISFLSWLPSLAREERSQLFIPDINGTLRPYDHICYNDLGTRSALVDIGNNYLAHSNISDGLAEKLGLKRLGLSSFENQYNDDDLDMGEDLITTIRNRLREYTDSQLLLEFVANASDAGASEFNVLLDKKAAPAKALISPRCSAFQSVPALVIHNDSVFEESDFKGILRTGIGGKSDKSDTIGQFGLGALTMFHVTEFAMIVSRDQVLFLNPCKTHLSVGRASLRLPLSQVRKLYSDHLKPLDGLFGFELPEDIYESYSYNGTLFRLPLRSEAQFLDSEPIFRKVIFLEQLVSSFEAVARDCLLFTSISSIRCSERQFKISDLWSISASRSDCTEIEKHLNAHTVTIASNHKRDREWRVLSISVSDQQLPTFISSLREKYRLRVPPVVRIAASPSPASHHNLFSTLPLPITLHLPVHISASFILASDRRSIRLDEYENIEASYNRWLLQIIVPLLYSRLLEDRAGSDNSSYWPGKASKLTGTESVISKMVTDAVYKTIATSDASVFKSKYHEQILSPREAHLIGYMHPPVVSEVMDRIQPSGVVELPLFATRKLGDVAESHISLVTPKYVHAQILEDSTRFQVSELRLDQLQELTSFLCKSDGADCLIGLSLLPLEDGSFAKFDTSPDPCFYVAPLRATKKALFNCRRIVHRDFDTEMLLKIKHINIRPISNSNIQTLLNDHIAVNKTLEHADGVTQLWIKKFWKVFTSLEISPDSIADYPLIPTLRPDCYVSRNHCRTSSVIVADLSRNELQAECLAQMHFTLVDSASVLKDVRSTLQPSELSVENVLKKLFDSGKNISTLFNLLELDLRTRWVGWIRSCLRTQNKKYFQRHFNYRSLPLWKDLNGFLISANEVQMLPLSVPIDSVAPFVLSSTVVYDQLLKVMGIQPPSSVLSILNTPKYLEDDEAYRRLLNALLRHIDDNTSIPVPNSQRLIQDSSALYSSRGDLFLAAFGKESEKFILPSFRTFEPQLEKHGLRTQQLLSIATFKTCLDAFQNERGNDRKDRAAVIFRIFSEDLPLHANSSSDNEWRVLEELRFIPRLKTPQPLRGVESVSRYFAHHVRCLPDIVSPSELVRDEFQPIAWTQRAFYLSEPHSRVLMLHPSLSVPSATEVVNHLVVLAMDVAVDHARNHALIDHLKKTYKWLDENADDAQSSLMKCTRGRMPLFLNVDDPTSIQEDWEWKPADHILLDDYDTGFLQCPRDFIKPFRSLLAAAGAVSIDYGQEMLQEGSAEEEGELSFLERFNRMRHDGVCTDVHFTFDADQEPLHAHRAYLAAYTTHFRDMFSGFGVEASVASAAEPVSVHIEGFSRRSMECLLDYVYTSKKPDLKKEQSDLALEILVLAHGWLMTELQNAMQDIMIRPKMVDPFNLDHVREIARDTMSEELYQYCVRYEQRNSALVEQAREGSQSVGN